MEFLKAVILGRNILGYVLDWNGFFYNEHNLLDGYQQTEFFKEKTKIDIVWSISEIIDAKYDEIYEMFSEFKSHENWKDPSYFGSCILQAAPTFFQHGYTPENFLAFCAVVSGAVLLYYDEEVHCPDFADIAANIIGLVLIGHMITGEFFRRGSWQRLHAIAKTLLSTK